MNYRVNRKESCSLITKAIRRFSTLNRYELAGSTIFLIILGLCLTQVFIASAASFTMLPNADVATGWTVPVGSSTTCAGGVHCDHVDDGTTPADGDYVSTGSGGTTGEIEEFDLSSPTDVASATQVVITARLRSITLGSTADTVSIQLRVNGVLQTATTPSMTTTITNYTATYNGTWSQADIDSMKIVLTRNRVGSGNQSAQDDDVAVYNAYATMTYSQATSLEQASYRWFNNTDGSTGSTTFVKALGGASADQINDTVSTSDGGYIVAGSTSSFSASGDAFIAKYDKSGTPSWIKTWGSILVDSGNSVTPTSDGGYILVGITGSDTFLAKYDYAGSLVWSEGWGSAGSETFNSIAPTLDGGFVAAGYTTGAGAGATDGMVAKFDSAGTIVWSRTLGTTNGEEWKDVSLAGDGSILLTGNQTAGASNTVIVAKYSSSGTLSWYRIWDLNTTESATSITELYDGSYIVSGVSGGHASIAKYDSTGAHVWSKSWGGLAAESAYDVEKTTDGGFIISGFTSSFGAGGQDAFIAKFDVSGSHQWSRTFGGSGTENALSVSPTLDGGYTASGLTSSSGAGSNDAYISKYDSAGAIGGCSSPMCQSPTPTITTLSPTVATTGLTANSPTGTITSPTGTDTARTLTLTSIVGTAIPSIDVSTPLANLNTVASAPEPGTTFRLRLNLHGSVVQLDPGNKYFKLQFASKGASPTCSAVASGNFGDVSTSSVIRYAYNPVAASGLSLTTNANDPTHSSDSLVRQSYFEAGTSTFTNMAAIPTGQDGMWDFGLSTTSQATAGTNYCFRIVQSTGTALTTYTQYPEIAVGATGILGQKDSRLFQNADSTTPGAALASANTSAILSASGANFRLRNTLGITLKFSKVFSGANHSCGITSEGKTYCWGINTAGQLGNGNTGTNSNVPVAVSTTGVLAGKTILSMSLGGDVTCAIASDNQAYCWGSNNAGQLGNGNTGTNSNVPVAVSTTGVLAGKSILSISSGKALGVSGIACAIASDNQAYCWGDNSSGQLGNGNTGTDSNIPVAVSTTGVLAGKSILSISSGGNTNCVIASDNQAYCWGSNNSGNLGNGDPNLNSSSNVPVAVSTIGALAGKTVNSITSGIFYSCILASDNQAYCWGEGDDGQLGNGSTGIDSNVPVAVSTTGVLAGKSILSISGGSSFICAVASDNQAYCWGDNFFGQLGNGSNGTDSNVPVAVATTGVLTGKTVLSTSGGGSSCMVASDSQSYCWGRNAYGQLGNGNTGTDSNVPVAVLTTSLLTGRTLLSVSMGTYTACSLSTDGLAYCWGDNSDGQLGNGNTGTDSNVPVAVLASGALAGKTLLSITAGNQHFCGLASDSVVYCWGDNSSGQLGNGTGTTVDSNVPAAITMSGVLAGKTVLSVSAGGDHSCVIASDNKAYCWGDNAAGQLGNANTGTDSNVPVAVSTAGVLSGKTVLKISAEGSLTSCAIASDNKAYCWGDNFYGQLGNANTGTDSNVPVAVSTAGVLSGKTVLRISNSSSGACVIASDSLAYCWGDNVAGQLGNANTGTDSNVPVAVSTAGVLSGKTVSQISASDSNVCVIASDDKVYCWGDNGSGQLGNANFGTDSNVPVAVSTAGVLSGKTVSQISVGLNAVSCAVASDYQAYCWGANNEGELGNGDPPNPSNIPVAVYNSSPGLSISASTLSLKLQFGAKGSAGTCSAVSSYSYVTTTSAIAYADNASVANAANITTIANDPVASGSTTVQTYHESDSANISNPNLIAAGKYAMYDFSLKDYSAPGSTTYCLRLAGSDGTAVASYSYFPEFTTAVSAPTGPTLDQMVRGGQAVVNGVKSLFSF